MGNNEVEKFYSIIPKPNFIVSKPEEFEINRDSIIIAGEELKPIVLFLRKFLIKEYKLELIIENLDECRNKTNCIIFQVNEKLEEDIEGYSLIVNDKNINITAKTEKGLFYGIQTLIQMIYQVNQNSKVIEKESISLNCVEIHDSPRFKWRGFMLDESRHFFGKETVKMVLDIMAFLKFNTFHWHLSDDQGWRVEIKKLPLLTKIGSKRKGTDISKRKFYLRNPKGRIETDEIPVMGYYSQDDLKEIIDYATQRQINIVPEIDIPGHTTALLAAYPELSCTGGPFEVGIRFGIYKDVLCAGKEKVFKYIEEIFLELIRIFPSEYFHLGGDEVPKKEWKKCFDCQERMKQENINSLEKLQVYFMNRVSKFFMNHGKKVVCWNDVLSKDLNKHIYCQFWSGELEQIIEELKEGRKFIISQIKPTYLNYPYKFNSLKSSYQYDPIPIELHEGLQQNIIGIEACLWTEYIKTQENLEWQLFPRLIAISEINWTQKINQNYHDFEKRLKILLKYLKKKEINHASKEEYDGRPTERAEKYLKGS